MLSTSTVGLEARLISRVDSSFNQLQKALVSLQSTMSHEIESPLSTMNNDIDISEEGRNLRDSEWVVSIREKLVRARKDAAASSTDKLCIYRIPQMLREGNEKVYTPQVVSLGPYHRGDPQLCKMENQKWRILDHVLQRENQDIKLYLDAVTELEEEARSCYEGPIYLTKNQFVEMMILDGVFVIEFLLRGSVNLGYSSNDIVFSNQSTRQSIRVDMIKLENQLPIFILDTILGLQVQNQNVIGEIAKKIPYFFRPLKLTREFSISSSSDEGNLHCLDVFRKNLLKMSESEKVDDCLDVYRKLKMIVFEKLCCCFATTIKSGEYTHCAVELKDAGIKFKERKTNFFWDIKFQNGILKIPPISIQGSTKLVLLNLMAFEQCHPSCGNKITAYVVFMDHLIDSEQDVAYLRKKKIIASKLGSDAEVAILFNDLCKNILFSNRYSHLSKISDKINQYSQHKCNTWSASLKQKYFSNPWSSISLLAAAVLLALTLVQTIISVKDYHKR